MIKSVFNILTLERCYTCTLVPSPHLVSQSFTNSFVLMSRHALAALCGGVREGGGGPGGGRKDL